MVTTDEWWVYFPLYDIGKRWVCVSTESAAWNAIAGASSVSARARRRRHGDSFMPGPGLVDASLHELRDGLLDHVRNRAVIGPRQVVKLAQQRRTDAGGKADLLLGFGNGLSRHPRKGIQNSHGFNPEYTIDLIDSVLHFVVCCNESKTPLFQCVAEMAAFR